MSLSGAFYAFIGAGFTRRQALALVTAGYRVIGYQRVKVQDVWLVAS